MILTNLHLQVIGCNVCNVTVEIPRWKMRNPQAVMEMVERVTHDHRECVANPGNPGMARANRLFRKRMEREIAKARARQRKEPRGVEDRRPSAHLARG